MSCELATVWQFDFMIYFNLIFTIFDSLLVKQRICMQGARDFKSRYLLQMDFACWSGQSGGLELLQSSNFLQKTCFVTSAAIVCCCTSEEWCGDIFICMYLDTCC